MLVPILAFHQIGPIPPETRESRTALEALLSGPVRTVCYPWDQHDAAVHELARQAGYEY